jgi:hypothetical protein
VRRASPLLLAVLSVVAGCGNDSKPVASSKTCDAVRRLYRFQNLEVDDEARERTMKEEVITVALSERASDQLVRLARQYRWAVPLVTVTKDSQQPRVVRGESAVLSDLQTECEVAVGTPPEEITESGKPVR